MTEPETNKRDTVPAIEVAREREEAEKPVRLSTGYLAFIHPVAASLISDVSNRIPDPPIPKVFNPDHQRDEDNPLDPTYVRELAQLETQRAMAGMDAMILFGVEIVNMPEDDNWMKKLLYLEKKGLLDLSKFDTNDPIDANFLFLKYVAVGAEDYALISKKSGISAEEVEAKEKSFRGDA